MYYQISRQPIRVNQHFYAMLMTFLETWKNMEAIAIIAKYLSAAFNTVNNKINLV
jgi:hypothetical protein